MAILYISSQTQEDSELCNQLQDLSLKVTKQTPRSTKPTIVLRNVHDAIDLFKIHSPFSDGQVNLGELDIQDVISTLAIYGHHVISYILKLQFANATESCERMSILAKVLDSLTSQGHPLALARRARQRGLEDIKKTESTLSAIYTMLMKALSDESLVNNTDIHDILRLKCYALACLLENRGYFAKSQQQADNGPDKAVHLIVSQIHRAIVQYCKSASQDQDVNEAELASKISQPCISVLEAMHSTIGKESLKKCTAYSELSELLAKLAAKGSDEALLNAVNGMLAGSEDSEEQIEAEMSPEDLRKRVNDLCAQVVAQTAKLDKWIKSGK